MALKACPSCKERVESWNEPCPWCGESLAAPSSGDPAPPSAPTPAPESSSPPPGAEIIEGSFNNAKWRLLLEPDTLVLTPESGEAAVRIPREEVGTKVEIIDSFLGCLIEVRAPKKRTFKLPREVFDLLVAWLGPPTPEQLKTLIRKRLRWTIPAGIVLVLASLPMEGDPETRLEPIPFDPLVFAHGLSLLIIVIASKLFPNPGIFLMDALWCLAGAGIWVYNIVNGDHPAWGILVFFLLVGGSAAFRQYRRLAGVQSEPSKGPADSDRE